MSIVRRLLLLGCAAVALFVLLATPAVAFPDVPVDHPYAKAIDGLAARGIISGHLDGTFGPDDPVARCQFAKMIVNTLGIHNTDLSMPFTDVGPGDLPEFVAAAAAHGITNGTNQGGTLFSPWRTISRAQVLTMVTRAVESEYPGLFGRGVGGGMGFSPWGFFDPVHAFGAGTAQMNGLLEGIPALASLDPWAPMRRDEVAQVLWNTLGLVDRAARVTEVVDGDTIRAVNRGKNETIRLIGIDAPELGEPFGTEARNALAGMISSRGLVMMVRLQFDVTTRDEDGRLLAYVLYDMVPGWGLANEQLLGAGLATLHIVPPNVKYAEALQAAEDDAKANHRGIWGSSTQ